MLKQKQSIMSTTCLAAISTVMLVASGATAQEAQEDSTELDEIVVTGSLIRRDPANAATPLIQVTQEQLLTTGQTTIIDYLAKIPALANSTVPSDTTGSGLNDGGLSLPNLRSLGAGRTLTLVNGRRHVGSNAGSLSVDIDTIPRLLIENIEIVTGGASAIYGADAVSGVINFITRDDFEGAEIDANYGMINENGEATRRVSALIGGNFFDDRLNVYLHGEYEQSDEVQSSDIDWLNESSVLIGIDADPTNALYDGNRDTQLYTGVVRLDRPRWGQTTLANAQQPSALNDPDVPLANCSSLTSGNCYSVDPSRTYWFDGTSARLANFGDRVGNTGSSRIYNYGGDGESPGNFGSVSRVPYSESQRFQTGFTLALTDAIEAYGEAKYVTEDTFDVSQPTFFDVYLNNDSTASANQVNVIRGVSSFDLRLDNAFLPSNLRSAILANTVTNYSNPTETTAGTAQTPVSRAWARHSMFGPDRTQTNNREIQRYVLGFRGDADQFLFARNLSWDVGYTYGRLDNVNAEQGVDSQRFAYAADAVIDAANLVGRGAGATVCRIQLLNAQNPARATGAAGSTTNTGALYDYQRGGDLRDTEYGRNTINECQPLNIFGAGNQSQAALDYVDATIRVRQQNEQQQALATVSGELWDFWGAGPIGVAFGVEHRYEYTEGIGRSADTAGRLLFLNTGPDFTGAEYDSNEVFTELAIPLFRDHWLGQYAELSGSYRLADYSTVGEVDAYGVNLVYRPVEQLTFKTSLNTSVRVPNLSELNSPYTQTFFNNVNDPCATTTIANQASDIRANRIANCTLLAQAKGLTYDFAGSTATNTDDYVPVYTSGVAGVNGGNPDLKPEESESFTFSAVYRPEFIPNLTLVLDYYSIEITDVIASVSAQTAANNCVSGPSLNASACNTIFRNNAAAANPTTAQERSEAFKIGAPVGDPIGAFIQGSINYAAYETSGIDFTIAYSFDTREMLDRGWGRFDWAVNGNWLRKQDYYVDAANPTTVTAVAGTFDGTNAFPRVRFSSSLTWQPLEDWRFNWTADWQSSLEIVDAELNVGNLDTRQYDQFTTGNYVRHDFTVNWSAREDLDVRFGVVNAFDAEQNPVLGVTQYDNYDAYGPRWFVGLNFRPW
jgi:outer membrane receptor protein involved in Fe transport